MNFICLGLSFGDFGFGELDKFFEYQLYWDWVLARVIKDNIVSAAYLDSANIGILRCVLVLVKPILCRLSLPQVDAELDKEEHDRFKGSDRTASSSF